MHALTVGHFYIMCHHLFYARRKLSFWSYFINEWVLYVFMNGVCVK